MKSHAEPMTEKQALEAVAAAKDTMADALMILPRDCYGWSKLEEAVAQAGKALMEYEDDGYPVP